MTDFSVVVTTKDRQHFLDRVIESIGQNTVLPSQIVVVNDGGARLDETQFTEYRLPIELIQLDSSCGANFARNLGIHRSKNEIVFLIDDDDAFTQDSFQSRLQKMVSNTDIGLCFTGMKVVSDSDLTSVIRTVHSRSFDNYHYALLRYGNVIGSTSRVAIRKRAFLEAGGFDEHLRCMQDFDLWIRMAKATSIAHDGGCGVVYTVHQSKDRSAQISKSYEKYLEAGLYLYDKYYEEIDGYKCSSRFLAAVYRRAAISAASISLPDKLKYAALSIGKRPSLKAFALFLPYGLLKAVKLLG